VEDELHVVAGLKPEGDAVVAVDAEAGRLPLDPLGDPGECGQDDLPALPGCPDWGGPEIILPVLASSGTVAGLFSLLGAREVRVWPPRQFPG
jgi:hypothetical protein